MKKGSKMYNQGLQVPELIHQEFHNKRAMQSYLRFYQPHTKGLFS